MMKDAKWHYRSPNKTELIKAIKEIDKKMRNVFADEIYLQSLKRKDIYVLVADISPAGKISKFQKKKS